MNRLQLRDKLREKGDLSRAAVGIVGQNSSERYSPPTPIIGTIPISMHGTLNGVQLRKITSLKMTVEASGVKLTSFRVMQSPLPECRQVGGGDLLPPSKVSAY